MNPNIRRYTTVNLCTSILLAVASVAGIIASVIGHNYAAASWSGCTLVASGSNIFAQLTIRSLAAQLDRARL